MVRHVNDHCKPGGARRPNPFTALVVNKIAFIVLTANDSEFSAVALSFSIGKGLPTLP